MQYDQNQYNQSNSHPYNTPIQPAQLNQPNQATQQVPAIPATVPPIQSQRFNLALDEKASKILGDCSPEMVNAMVCIALKKFSKEKDFIDYFVKEEFLEYYQVQENFSEVQEEVQEVTQTTQIQTQPSIQPAVSFDDFGIM